MMLDLASFPGPLEKSDFRTGLWELEARCYTYSQCVENHLRTCAWVAYNYSHSGVYFVQSFRLCGYYSGTATIRLRLLFEGSVYLKKYGTPKLSFNNKAPFSSYTNFTPQMTPEGIFPLR